MHGCIVVEILSVDVLELDITLWGILPPPISCISGIINYDDTDDDKNGDYSHRVSEVCPISGV